MAEVDPEQVIGCLTLVYPTFVQREIARLTAESIAVLESVIDPLGQLADKNIDSIIDDVTGLATGDVLANLVEAGVGLLWQEKVRDDLRDSINGAFEDKSKDGTFLERAGAKIEKLMQNINLLLALSIEAPYAIAQIVYEGALPFIDQKRRNLDCLKHHVVQLANVLLALGVDPLHLHEQMGVLLEALRSELGLAQQDIRVVLNNMLKKVRLDAGNVVTPQINFAVQGGFLTARFNSARLHLFNANAVLSPANEGTNILMLASAAGRAAIGDEFATDANRLLGIYTAQALVDILKIEMLAIEANTKAINAYLLAASAVTADLAKVKESSKINEFRIRALRRMDQTLTEMLSEIPQDEFPDIGESNFLMLKWASNVRSLIGQADKVVNADLTQQTATSELVVFLKIELAKVQAAIAAIDVPPDIVDGNEDITIFKAEVETLQQEGRRLLKSLKAAKDPQRREVLKGSIADLVENAALLANQVVNRALTSQDALDALEAAIRAYLAVDIPAAQDLKMAIDMLNLSGLDRAADHLKAGLVNDFFNLTPAGASYAGAVAICLIESMNAAPDQATRERLNDILDGVLGAAQGYAVMTADILTGGRVQFISDITAKIEDLNRNTQFANDLIARMKQLGADTALALQQTYQRLSGLDVALGQVTMSAGSDMNTALRNLTTKGFGPPGCS